MINEILQKAVDGKLTPSDADAVAELVHKYPYFTVPAAALLRDCAPLLDADLRQRLTQSVALAAPDTSIIYMLLDKDNAEHANFYPDNGSKHVTTENAINTFLTNYGSISTEEEALLNRLIFNPTPDYAQILAAEEESSIPDISATTGDNDQDRLNAFIVKQKQAAGKVAGGVTPEPIAQSVADRHNERRDAQPVEETSDNSLLSESLAKIFIKQRHYERAYEIISQLSLNYPEKSVYFADQLRFLRKLIINSNHKKSQ